MFLCSLLQIICWFIYWYHTPTSCFKGKWSPSFKTRFLLNIFTHSQSLPSPCAKVDIDLRCCLRLWAPSPVHSLPTESHCWPHKSTAFFFHTFTTYKHVLFFGLWLYTAVHHHIQFPFLSWHRQNGVRLMSKSCSPLQLILFCICWHWAPPVILFTLVQFSGDATNLPHSWQTPRILFKRLILEYSTLNLLLYWKWIHPILCFLFLGFCSHITHRFSEQKQVMFFTPSSKECFHSPFEN